MKYDLKHGDCLEVMRTMEPESVDSIVADPPAGIAFMGKAWDKDKGGYGEWIDWMRQVAEECKRVIKPGGYALVWAIPRTSHWTGMAWELAGWEPRDKIYHAFGSGFPKSLNIGKAVDKLQGNEREDLGMDESRAKRLVNQMEHSNPTGTWRAGKRTVNITKGSSPFEGWGTALKPSIEEWWLFRKPLSEKTVAENVLKYGTGGLNIDGCRVGTEERPHIKSRKDKSLDGEVYGSGINGSRSLGTFSQGRFPSHLILDGSDEVRECFPETSSGAMNGVYKNTMMKGKPGIRDGKEILLQQEPSSGSASRFFKSCPFDDEDFEAQRLIYIAKASKQDRGEDNSHPTVKPFRLMQYLCRLITPPKGIILDPFMGSGSTGKGAVEEGFEFIGIDEEFEYVKISEKRISLRSQGRLF